MTKLEDTNKWSTVVRMAGEGASLREIAEEVDATPGAINVALKRMGIEKAPAPPGPRARRGASPPPPKGEKVPKVGGEPNTRQKAAKAPTFPSVFIATLAEMGMDFPLPNKKYTVESVSTPAAMGDVLREAVMYEHYRITGNIERVFNTVLDQFGLPHTPNVKTVDEWADQVGLVFKRLGLTPKDNLSDADDCDENTDSDFTPSVQVDADVNSEDDGVDCDGSDNTEDVVHSVSGDFDGLNVVGLPVVTFDADSQPSVVGEVIGQEINEDGGLSVQIAVDPNEVTLRGEVIDDWGTPPSFTIPSDEELASMNRDDLRKLAANPGLKGWAYLKGYSKMSPDDLRANLAKVRNDSV